MKRSSIKNDLNCQVTQFSIECSGYCEHSNHVTDSSIPYCKSENIKFPSLFGFLKHSKYGYILYDTGYCNRFYKETSYLPYYFYGKLTPVFLNENESASEILLSKFGIKSEQVNFIVISHFHADHISGLIDFENAKYIYSKEGFEYLKERKDSSCCSDVKCCLNGFIPNLLPKDFEKRSWPISMNDFRESKDLPFKVFDLFGDDSIHIVDLPGHCFGHFGLFFKSKFNPLNNDDNHTNSSAITSNTSSSSGVVNNSSRMTGEGEKVQEQCYLFVGDSAWSTRAIKLNALPHIVTKYLVQYDWSDYIKTLDSLHKIYNESSCHIHNLKKTRKGQEPVNPSMKITNHICLVPSHCWQVYEKYCLKPRQSCDDGQVIDAIPSKLSKL